MLATTRSKNNLHKVIAFFTNYSYILFYNTITSYRIAFRSIGQILHWTYHGMLMNSFLLISKCSDMMANRALRVQKNQLFFVLEFRAELVVDRNNCSSALKDPTENPHHSSSDRVSLSLELLDPRTRAKNHVCERIQWRPSDSRNISRPPFEKRPAKNTTPGILSFAGRFRLSLDVQQRKSTHFPYKSTLLIEHQKQKNAQQKKKWERKMTFRTRILRDQKSQNVSSLFWRTLVKTGTAYHWVLGTEKKVPSPGSALLGAFGKVGAKYSSYR